MRLVYILLICFAGFACNQAKKDTNTPDPGASNILSPNPDNNPLTPPAATSPTTTGIYDIWVLDSINNKPVNPADYTGGTPYIEFTPADSGFNAHSGCNSFTGKAAITETSFKINQLKISKNKCKNPALESLFVKALSDKKAGYKIENNKLYLSAGSAVHTFRRITR